MKQILALLRCIYSFFFKKGVIGVQRFFICFCLPSFLLLTWIFKSVFNYFFISSILAATMLVVPIVLIIAIVLACFGLFEKPDNCPK